MVRSPRSQIDFLGKGKMKPSCQRKFERSNDADWGNHHHLFPMIPCSTSCVQSLSR